MNELLKRLIGLTSFSIAAGFVESAIVIYLRKIYYPSGFHFPLVPFDSGIAMIEFLREFATIVMLLSIGIITGKNILQKFAYSIFSFALWDLFYYLFLKILIGWPESFITWDILFLIPVPWIGPVIAPCIVSVTLLIFSCYIIYFEGKGYKTKFKSIERLLIIIGPLFILTSFVWDYMMNIGSYATSEISKYIPTMFNWWLFAAGQLLFMYGIMIYITRLRHEKSRRFK
jgi:hypothetical protein